jgi:hypothetical protein
MINDQEFLHGAAFLRLINLGQPVTITHASSIHASLYMVNSKEKSSGILFKVSTKARSAWSFSFSEQEDFAVKKLKIDHPGVYFFAALICHKDGICCLSEDQIISVFDVNNPSFRGQRVSVSRKPYGSYHITGMGKIF